MSTVSLLALQGDLPARLAAGDADVLEALRSAVDDGEGQQSSAPRTAIVLGLEERPLSYDPVALATSLAVRVPGLPVIVSSDGVRDHPYNAARRFLSLDHLNGGRAGVVFRGGAAPSAHTAERIQVIRQLWNSWPRESLVADPEAGIYAHTDSIRAIDHSGPWFRVAGALNSPTSIQSEPVTVWEVTTAEELNAAHGAVDLVLLSDPWLLKQWHASTGKHRPALAELVHVDSLPHIVEALTAAPKGSGTLRFLLGLPARAYDLSNKPLAFGASRA